MKQELINKTKNELTLLFFIIQLSIIVILNVGIIFFDFGQVRNLRGQFVEVRTGPIVQRRVFTEDDFSRIENAAQLQRQERLLFIFTADVVLAFVSAFLARVLANITLKPLVANMDNQKQFISTASHELRTPLTTIKVEAEILQRNKQSSLEEYKIFANNVIAQIDSMTALTQSLLYLSQVEHISIAEKKQFSLDKVIATIIESNQRQIEQKSLTVTTDNLNHQFFTNKELFARMISVIFDNAIKYNKPEGTIAITYDHIQSSLVIRDSGKGISQNDLTKIFEPFFKSKTSKNSFGIGLSIAQNISKLLGTPITVASIESQGTTFTIDTKSVQV